MIYTLTINPALDYVMSLEEFNNKGVNRTQDTFINPGGKGINVSMMLSALGSENTALGFIAGFTGDELTKILKEKNINTNFIRLKDGITRINVKIKSKNESEINANGPNIKQEDINRLFDILDKLTNKDYLVLAGSIPSCLKSNFYEIIMERLNKKGVNIIIDATKDLLLKTLKYNPFLIKPNHHELGELFNTDCSSEKDIILYAKKLKEMGARNVLVSRAKDGAILVDEEDNVYKSKSPKGTLINSVGAGDSMVGGFLYGYINKGSYEEALKYGISSGSASAFSKAIATKEDVMNLYFKL